jgi:hypothetical protein
VPTGAVVSSLPPEPRRIACGINVLGLTNPIAPYSHDLRPTSVSGGRSAVSLMAHRYQLRHAGPVPARGPQEISVLFAGGLLPQADAPIVRLGKRPATMTIPIVFAIGATRLRPDWSPMEASSSLHPA